MDNKKMVVDTRLSFVNYLSVVENIASEYFNEDGEYAPHYGKINVMRLFYNECVRESKFDIPHNITEATEMLPLLEDDEFLSEYKEAIENSHNEFSFANAYRDAMDIVNTRKNSLGYAVEAIKNGITKIIDKISPVLSEDNIDKLAKIADDVSSGNLSPETIIEAFKNSKTIKK